MSFTRVLSLLIVSIALAALSLGACRRPRKLILSKDQQETLQKALLKKAPKTQHPIGAILDHKVELIGFDISGLGAGNQIKAGSSFKITWYWKALANLHGDWKIFVHLESPGNKRTIHDHQAVGELYPLSKWKKGQIIKDAQTIAVAKDFPDGPLRLYVGIFDEAAWVQRQQNVRMQIVNLAGPHKIRVPVDRQGRIEALSMTLIGGKPATSLAHLPRHPMRYVAYRAATPPVIDGMLGDAAWKAARPTRPYVRPNGGPVPASERTVARVTWDAKNLYLAIEATDDDIWNTLEGRDARLWTQDAVEIYLDPGPINRDYVELQISPTGDIFDAHFVTHREPSWPIAAKNLTMSHMKVKVHVDGSVNKRGDGVQDKGWTVEVAIPWTDIPTVTGPPSIGTTWAVNFYRIDAKSPKRPGYMEAWSPAGGDFHNLSRFGRLVFEARPPALHPGPKVPHLSPHVLRALDTRRRPHVIEPGPTVPGGGVKAPGRRSAPSKK